MYRNRQATGYMSTVSVRAPVVELLKADSIATPVFPSRPQLLDSCIGSLRAFPHTIRASSHTSHAKFSQAGMLIALYATSMLVIIICDASQLTGSSAMLVVTGD